MKTVFLLFVVFTNNGVEQIGKASNQEFDSAEMCEIEMQDKEVTESLFYFCGDSRLYFNKQQVFY